MTMLPNPGGDPNPALLRSVGPLPHARSVRVAAALTTRSLMLITRQPATFVPSLVFPVIVVVAFSGAFGALVGLGFPVPKMVDWMLPMAVVQGSCFAGVTIGLGVSRDIEGRFYDRLLMAPVGHGALLAGALGAAVIRATIPFVVVLAAGIAAGARLRGGVPGLLMLLVAGCGASLAAAGWALGLAYRIPTQRAAPLMQVGIFLAVFLSTAQVPLEVMRGWLRVVAQLNPMTEILGLARQGFIGPVTWNQTWPGLVAIAAISTVTVTFAARGLRRLVP